MLTCRHNSLACQLLAWLATWIILLSVAAGSESDGISGHVPCGGNGRCSWKVPPIESTGCCPKEIGQDCHPALGELCNVDFGLVCVDSNNSSQRTELSGICRGPFNLTATRIEEKKITLEWNAFAPQDYYFEYVLMVREVPFHRDISRWDIRDCGEEAICTMRRLSPDTTYLAKMAIWEDVRANKLGTTTETIVVTTRGVEYCEDGGQEYEVGKAFIHEQEENCTCLPSGEFDCFPLCPNGIPELEEGCRAVLGDECQYNISCTIEKSFEDNENELCSRYSEGTELRSECQVCICVKEKLKCSYTEVCDAINPKPPCKHLKSVDLPGQCCPAWECEDVCDFENKTYSGGELFTSLNCGLCQCQPTGKVECISKCPPVEMVAPSYACPSPHIKRSGCCDTLHCFRGESDVFSYVHNLVAFYTTAVSMSLSFDLEPACEFDGFPSYCYYRIQYANTSSSQLTDSSVWNNRIVQPMEVVNDGQSGYSHPIDVLTRDSAVVINNRAVITLSGMHPRTEFYVVVIQEDGVKEDMMEIDDPTISIAKKSLAAKVVVKTRPLQNDTSCFYAGREVLHGEIVSKTCSQRCQCRLGQIECHSTCEDEQVVIAASLSCPQPILERSHGDCCPKWHCTPTVSGCYHNKAVLRTGQIISDGCQECICTNSTVRCVSLCPPTGLSPRSGCSLTNHTGHCCPQWSCPLEKSSPIAIESSVLLKFAGSCQAPVKQFKEKLSREVLEHITSLMNCSDSTRAKEICSGGSHLEARVECNPKYYEPESRKKRSTDGIQGVRFFQVLVSVRRNFSSERDPEIVFRSGLDLQKILNTSLVLQLSDKQTFRSSPGAKLRKQSYICPLGFTYKNGQCVLSEIDIMGSLWARIQLSGMDVSSTSVTFQWSPLETNLQRHILHLHINYRIKGTMAWTSSKLLSPWRTSITISNLYPGTSYTGSLVAVSKDNDEHKWTLSDTTFETNRLPGTVTSISLKEVSVTANTVIVYWGLLSDEFWDGIHTAKMIYWISNSNQTKEIEVKNRELPFITIDGLSSGTEYTVQLVLRGKTIRSQMLRLHTLPSEKCDSTCLVPILIACSGTVAFTLVFILVLLWRRQHKKNNSNDFENKTFGIGVETGASNVSTITSSIS